MKNQCIENGFHNPESLNNGLWGANSIVCSVCKQELLPESKIILDKSEIDNLYDFLVKKSYQEALPSLEFETEYISGICILIVEGVDCNYRYFIPGQRGYGCEINNAQYRFLSNYLILPLNHDSFNDLYVGRLKKDALTKI